MILDPTETPGIALVTPLKNEMLNIPKLINGISSQTIPIEYWVIVENGSDDGSKQYLAEIKNIPNVRHFIVLNFSLSNDKYELGIKYATVVNQGFKYLEERNLISKLDYIGILDADCFPEKDYYKKLHHFMSLNPKMGISSGVGYTLDGKYDGEARSWVRGNCRLWKTECFLDAGYIIGPSADTLSLCKAEIKGWEASPDHSIIYHCREMGKKVNYSYYGYSTYFRGISPLYAILKSFYLGVIKRKPVQAKGFFKGYFDAYLNKKNRVADAEILNKFDNYLFKKIKAALS